MQNAIKQKPQEYAQVQPLLTIPKVASLLGVSRPTVYELIAREGLPTVKLGRSVRVSPDSLRNWLAERERVR